MAKVEGVLVSGGGSVIDVDCLERAVVQFIEHGDRWEVDVDDRVCGANVRMKEEQAEAVARAILAQIEKRRAGQ